MVSTVKAACHIMLYTYVFIRAKLPYIFIYLHVHTLCNNHRCVSKVSMLNQQSEKHIAA